MTALSPMTNFMVFINGIMQQGKITNFTPPKLVAKMEDVQTGGMLAPVEIELGIEKLEASFKTLGFPADVMKMFNNRTLNGVPLRLRGAENDAATGESIAVEINLRGRFKELGLGELAASEQNEMDVLFSPSYYKYSRNGEDIIEIDVINFIYKVGGVDLGAKTRAALGLT